MSTYPPPIENVLVFNSSLFTSEDDFITIADGDLRWCRNSNGVITGSLNVLGPIYGTKLFLGNSPFDTALNMSILDHTLLAGSSIKLRLGVDDTAYNYSDILFHYELNASDTNYLSIGGLNSYTSKNLVSINTINPATSLDINNSTGQNMRLIFNNTTGTPSFYTDFLTTGNGDLSITNQRFTDITNHDGLTKGLALGGTLITKTADDINNFPDLTGLTASVAELNILDGATLNTAELNILDGVTATATELNYLSGATPGAGLDFKALVLDGNQSISSGINIFTVSSLKLDFFYKNNIEVLPSAQEFNILDGATLTTTELNVLDGYLGDTTDLNYLQDITPGLVEANKCVVVDSNRDITNFNNIRSTGNMGINTQGVLEYQLEISHPTGDCFKMWNQSGVGLWGDVELNDDGHIKLHSSGKHVEFEDSHLYQWSIDNHQLSNISKADLYDIVIQRKLNTQETTSGLAFVTGTQKIENTLPDATILFKSSNVSKGSMVFSTRISPTTCDERMRIDDKGYIGINCEGIEIMRELEIHADSGENLRLSYNSSGNYYTDLLTTASGDLTITNQRYCNISNHNGTTLGLQLGGVLLTKTASEINSFPDFSGLTSSIAELNILDGCTATYDELNYLSGVSPGTAIGSKALVFSSGRNIGNINDLTSTYCNINNFYTGTAYLPKAKLQILNDLTATATELNYNDISTLGSVYASKTVTADTNKHVRSLGSLAIYSSVYGKDFNDLGTRLQVRSAYAIYTDISASSTIPWYNDVFFGYPVLRADNPNVTITNAATLFIKRDPLADANVTITNKYALYIESGNNYIGGSLNIINGLSLNNTLITATATELNYVDITSPGAAQPSKALILNSGSSINSGISNFSAINFTGTNCNCTSYYINSTLITATATELNLLDGVTATTAELNYLDIPAVGNAYFSKALVVDNNLDIKQIHLVESEYLEVEYYWSGTNYVLKADLQALYNITNGTGQANRALVLDSSRNIDTINELIAAHLLIGISTSSIPLYINDNSTVGISNYGYINSSGSTGSFSGSQSVPVSAYFNARIVVTGEVDILSDSRLKNSIEPLSLEYSKRFITKIQPKTFKLNKDEHEDINHLGYIAQDLLKEDFHELVNLTPEEDIEEEIDDDGFLSPKDVAFSVSYTNTIPVLHRCIADLYHETDAIRKENNCLKQNSFKMFDEIIQLKKQLKNVCSIIDLLNTSSAPSSFADTN